MNNDIRNLLGKKRLYLDGGMGTLLVASGLMGGEPTETLCLTRPDLIASIHRAYLAAGANIIATNTFGASSLKLHEEKLNAVITSAVTLARLECERAGGDRFVALDVGPLGRMLEPFGDLPFEEAVRIFKKTVSLGVEAGADLVFIETMNDISEARAALLAAKETTDLPVFVSCAYGEDGRLMSGTTPESAVITLEALGADAIGVNCSMGPDALAPIVKKYLEYSSLPIILKPNAGLPRMVGDKTVYDVSPKEFVDAIKPLVKDGVSLVGGCCGTTPEYIKALVDSTRDLSYTPPLNKNLTAVSSHSRAVIFGDRPILIGERINPTGKPKLKSALLSGDLEYVIRLGITEEEEGADVLDVNVGLPGIDEKSLLLSVIRELSPLVETPLELDTADPVAMEAALRTYPGAAMINSVNGKAESLSTVLPLAKKYGGVLVALTLDEHGIPERAEDRLEIAKKILAAAADYGIPKNKIIFDPLALAVSADKNAAIETVKSVRLISEKLGAKTMLGVSNVSFGLPERESITAAYLVMALEAGLSAAIMNPSSETVMRAYRSYLALCGMDESFADYINYSEKHPTRKDEPIKKIERSGFGQTEADSHSPLSDAIVKGISKAAARLTAELLESRTPSEIIEKEIIPALDLVGVGFEEKRIYLPTLLLSAEAASAAFDVVKAASDKKAEPRGVKVVLATVKGDIHDIGKNIVKLMLENYGFEVVDLGRDVTPEHIVGSALSSGAHVVGLSALMTTTVPAMEETVRLLRARAPHIRVIVGGAVLSRDYARKMGAEYAPDAMGAVRFCESVEADLKSR